MRITFATALAAALLVSACGGGQTDATDEEEALANEYDPSAPSPGGAGNAANQAAPAPTDGNAH